MDTFDRLNLVVPIESSEEDEDEEEDDSESMDVDERKDGMEYNNFMVFAIRNCKQERSVLLVAYCVASFDTKIIAICGLTSCTQRNRTHNKLCVIIFTIMISCYLLHAHAQ